MKKAIIGLIAFIIYLLILGIMIGLTIETFW